jgi:hypothetical protein
MRWFIVRRLLKIACLYNKTNTSISLMHTCICLCKYVWVYIAGTQRKPWKDTCEVVSRRFLFGERGHDVGETIGENRCREENKTTTFVHLVTIV